MITTSDWPEWPYRVVIHGHDWVDVQDWCIYHIGEFGAQWYKLGIDIASGLDGDASTYWYFKQPEHAVLFGLRWS